jgi:hypothetical protein
MLAVASGLNVSAASPGLRGYVNGNSKLANATNCCAYWALSQAATVMNAGGEAPRRERTAHPLEIFVRETITGRCDRPPVSSCQLPVAAAALSADFPRASLCPHNRKSAPTPNVRFMMRLNRVGFSTRGVRISPSIGTHCYHYRSRLMVAILQYPRWTDYIIGPGRV